MNQRWCAICYHNNKNTNGICDADKIHQHYEEQHESIRNKWPHTVNTRSFHVKFKDNKPYLFDEVPCVPPPNTAHGGATVYLRHKKTEENIVNRNEHKTEYAIAFYKKPLRSAVNNYEWSMHTLWSAEMDGLFVVTIRELIPIYPLLAHKLEMDYPEVMDDVFNRSPNHLHKMSFEQKALALIREIKKCATWIRYFLKPVNELQDRAPNYYNVIKNPMDIDSLKRLVESGSLKTPKTFASKLMSIWINAQTFNPSQHKVHQCSIKCEIEAKRLLKKYFVEQSLNVDSMARSIQSSNDTKCAVVHYENTVRRYMLCPICINEHKSNNKLSFFIGYHTNCHPQKQCNKCHRVLMDTSIGYYHCTAGCHSKDHSIFLCEICAANHYDSPQIPHSMMVKDLPFNGLWISLGIDNENDFFYEAIICHQEANRVFFKLVFSSGCIDIDINSETEATISTANDQISFQVDDPNGKINNTLAQLDDSHSVIKFVNPHDMEDADVVYDKVVPKCGTKDCNSTLLFMRKDSVPCANVGSTRYCDVHHRYYEKHKECASFNAFKYDDSTKNRIFDVAFYYTCVKCKDFDICGGCTLIKMEQEWKKRNVLSQSNYEYKNSESSFGLRSPQTKKRKLSVSSSPSTMDSINLNNRPLQKRRKIKSKTVAKKQRSIDRKRKREEFAHASSVDIEKQEKFHTLYLKEKEKNEHLSLQLLESNEEIMKWKSKFQQLYSKVEGVLLNDEQQAPHPFCK